MADDLSKISKDLQEIMISAERAEEQVRGLIEALGELLRSGATGGTPTEQGPYSLISRYLKGETSTLVGRRVGGGAVTGRSYDFERKVDEAIFELIRAREEAAYQALRREAYGRPITSNKLPYTTPALRNVQSGETGIFNTASPEMLAKFMGEERIKDFELSRIAAENEAKWASLMNEAENLILTRAGLSPKTLEGTIGLSRTGAIDMPPTKTETIAEDRAIKLAAQFQGFNEAFSKFTGIENVAEQSTTIKKIIERLNTEFDNLVINTKEWDGEVRIVGTTVQELENGFKRVKSVISGTRIGDVDPSKGSISQYVSPANEVLDEQQMSRVRYDQMFQSKVLGPIQNLQGTTQSARMQMETNIRSGIKDIDQYSASVSNMYTKVSQVGEGLMMLTTVLNSVGSGEQKFVQFVRNGTQVLNEQELAALQLREELQQMQNALVNRLGQPTVDKLYAKAAERGFQPTDLKSVQTQEPSGVSIVRFKQWDEAAQVFQTLEYSVDRFGNMLTRTNRRMQGFFESVVKNTAELIRWSIGVGLVYGAYYKFQQLIDLAISNQDKLVDVTIALGNAQRDQNEIFIDAADVASKTGESINDVLEAYTMTYRAVGGVQDSMERTAASNKLLYTSTVLNKLSALDSASAIDILSGSLRQIAKQGETTAQSFDRGAELLDKWVAVTRNANVDLATLATAFSVTAESALNAGMTMDQLNAVIASLSEKIGGLGGKETGNAVRALIGGVYQQQAVGILTKYGIAVDDSTGKMRNFLDISRDVYELYQAKIIDETQLNKIGYVLGGGVRRGQQYVAFLKDYQRIQEITAIQENATGQASEALALKLDTVATSTTMVSNAFQTWAQTLGTDGGLLDTIAGFNTLLSGTVDVLTVLTKTLGSVTIPAALLGIFALFGGFRDQSKWLKIATPFITTGGKISDFGQTTVGGGIKEYRKTYTSEGPQMIPWAMPGTGIRGAIGQGVSRTGEFVGKYGLPILAGLAGAAPRIAEVAQGREKSVEGLAANAAGAVVGGIIGALTGPQGALVGTVIGQAIGDSFYQNLLNYKPEFTNFFRETWKIPEPPGTTPPQPKTVEERMAENTKFLFQEFEKSVYGERGSPFTGETVGVTSAFFANLFKTSPGMPKGAEFQGTTPEQYARDYLKQFDPEAYARVLKQFEDTALRQPTEITPEMSKVGQYEEKGREIFGGIFDSLLEELRKKYQDQMIEGEISPTEYRTKVTSTQGALASSLRFYGAINDLSTESLTLTKENEAEITKLAEMLIDSSDEVQISIAQLTNEYYDVSNALQSLDGKAVGTRDKLYNMTAPELATRLAGLKGDINAITEALNNAAIAATEFKMPEITRLEGISPDELKEFFTQAQDYQRQNEERIKDLIRSGKIVGISVEEFDALAQKMKAEAPQLFYDLGEAIALQVGNGIYDAGYLQDLIRKALEEGASNMSYQFMDDVTKAQLDALEPQYQAMRNAIIQGGLAQGLSQTQAEALSPETGMLTFLQDTSSPIYMQKDWKIVQYLLQQILKTEEKQLDGIYNLPSGASFYVPFQAWKMDTETRQAGAEQGPTGPVDVSVTTDLEPPVNKFGQYVEEFGGIFAGFVGKYSKDQLSDKDKKLINELRLNEKFGTASGTVPEGTPGFVPKPEYDPLKSAEELAKAKAQAIAWEEFMTKFAAQKFIPLTSYTNEFGQPEGVPPRAPTTAAEEITLTSQIIEAIKSGFSTSFSPGGIDFTNSDFGVAIGEAISSGLSDLTIKLDTQISTISNWLEALKQGLNIGGTDPQTSVPDTSVPNVKTDLRIELAAQTQLIVDGRVLADLIKPYLWSDLVAYQNTAGTAAGTFTAV